MNKRSYFALFLSCLFCLTALSHYTYAQSLQDESFIKEWKLLGPISIVEDGDDEAALKELFDQDQIDVSNLSDLVTQSAININGTEYSWIEHQSGQDEIDLDQALGEHEFCVAYAYAELVMDEAQSVFLGVGSDDAIKIWLNGELIHENWVLRALSNNDDMITADLREGKNTLLVKVANGMVDWGFSIQRLGEESLAKQVFVAAQNGDIKALETLIENRVDLNTPNPIGITPYQIAKIKGRHDVIQMLEANGVDQSVPFPPKEKMVDFIIERAIEDHSPAVAALAAKDGEILYQKTFGLADMSHNINATPETKFRIGSVTKQFTSAAILKLAEEGKLKIDDPLSKFIEDFPKGDEITIYHLMTHTSGIASYTSRPDFVSRMATYISPDDLVNEIKQFDFDFEPGEKIQYNNSGYFLMSFLVEQLTDMSFDEYLAQTFFEPLDMNNTGIHQHSKIIENEAYGYAYDDGEWIKAKHWDMSWAGGAGALYSTLEDLFRWNEGIFSGDVLSKESRDQAFSPSVLKDGSEANFNGSAYGFGWGLLEKRGLKLIAHGGGLDGFQTDLARYPEENFTVAVFTNSSPTKGAMSPGHISSEIAEIYLWEAMETIGSQMVKEDVDTSQYKDYVGRYEYQHSMVMTVRAEDGHLFAQLTGQPEYEIFPSDDDKFFWKIVDAQIEFIRNKESVVTHAMHTQNGGTFKAPKLENEASVELSIDQLKKFVGTYQLAPGVNIDVIQQMNQLYVQITGQPKFEIFPRSENEFFLKVVKADITFNQNDAGEIESLTLVQAGNTSEAKRVK